MIAEPSPPELQVTKVETTSDKRQCNAFLARGWRLLRLLVRRDEDEYPLYILGWDKAGQPDYPNRGELR